jgi:hypothetical protein
VLGNAQGFVHSSIPLAAATIEALGNKLETWTTTITYDPADINTENVLGDLKADDSPSVKAAATK